MTSNASIPCTVEQMVAIAKKVFEEAGIQPLPQPQPVVNNIMRVQGGSIDFGKLVDVMNHLLVEAGCETPKVTTAQPKQNPKKRKLERHYYCKVCYIDHPGVNCAGEKVECRGCNKMGHREYECFHNPASLWFVNKGKAKEQVKPRWEDITKSKKAMEENAARWEAYEERCRMMVQEEAFRVDLRETYEMLRKMEVKLLENLRMKHQYATDRDEYDDLTTYEEAMKVEEEEYHLRKKMKQEQGKPALGEILN